MSTTTTTQAVATRVSAVGVVVPRATGAILLGVEGQGLARHTMQTRDLGSSVAATQAADTVASSVAGLEGESDHIVDIKCVDVGHQLLVDKVCCKPIKGGWEHVDH
jgi:uncharacterized membrane protein